MLLASIIMMLACHILAAAEGEKDLLFLYSVKLDLSTPHAYSTTSANNNPLHNYVREIREIRKKAEQWDKIRKNIIKLLRYTGYCLFVLAYLLALIFFHYITQPD